VGGLGLGVALPPRIGQAHVDALAVHVAHGPLHQSVLLEPADQAGPGALAQVHGLSEFLNAELVSVVLGQPLEHLEFADSEPMPFAQSPTSPTACPRADSEIRHRSRRLDRAARTMSC
jgi:hypothetical protein